MTETGGGFPPIRVPGRAGVLGFAVVAIAAATFAVLAWIVAGGFPEAATGSRGPWAGVDEPAPAPPLPLPVANNAVAASETADGWALFSFLGIDGTRGREGITTAAFRWTLGSAGWRRIGSVPGEPRLAATAQAVDGLIYLFGGYTVAEDGSERSVPDVWVYHADQDYWTRAGDMPTPVDDAVSGVWRDSLIYVVSGWHDTDNVSLVQVYDPANDEWRQATPIPGPPVFGHAGGIGGDAIVYVDGTRVDRGPRRFALETSSWIGQIDPAEPTRIAWRRLPDHPGPGLYRAAAVGTGRFILFAGGTDNPYNYDGNGYDGVPSEPLDGVFAWDAGRETWRELAPLEIPTMDHRGLVEADGHVYAIGGMGPGRAVTGRTAIVR